MLDLSSVRKNKVSLTDYNCQQDIENRMLMDDFSAFELEVLEEILFSPLKISIKKLTRSMDSTEEDLAPILKKLGDAGLLAMQEEYLLVDKELRKYFEFQIVRFDPDFKPDMEFLSALLRKVPIHHLPAWYAIPRTSNNIFESIVEKYLLTPQIFQRYLSDLNFGESPLQGIVSDLFAAPEFKLYSSDVIAKYNLTRREFEELMLLLEFNFIGCISFEKEDDHWIEVITPFYEWHQYLRFLRTTETPRISHDAAVERFRKSDFSFVEDMTKVLAFVLKKPIHFPNWQPGSPLPPQTAEELAIYCSLDDGHALEAILQKLILTELASFDGQKLKALDGAKSWLAMASENKALHLYRHQKNRILNPALPSQLLTERNIRESEKALKRVLHGDWVFFDDFFKGILVTLSENSVIVLKRTGKHYKYSLPVYSEDEKNLLKAIVFEWLFETGMVRTGTYRGCDCFAVTPFGRFFFEE